MKKQLWFTLLLVLCLLAGSFGVVAADTEEPPAPQDQEEVTDGELFTHPVLSILAAYFGRETDDETTPDDGSAPNDGTTPDEGEMTIEEEIATFHQDGVGFGVLVKLYAMAEASKAACDAQSNPGDTPAEGEAVQECVPVTAAELVAQFKSGSGMGQLFKEYGKPALLGVGHVKKALKNLETTPALQQGKPEKVKSNNGNGKKK